MKLLPVLLVLVISCDDTRPGVPQAASPRPLREISAPIEAEGFADVALSIRSIQDKPDATLITAAGLHNGREVGLRITVAKGMKPGVTSSTIDRTAFRQGGIRFESIGAPSDAFLSALADLYQARGTAPGMRSAVEFVAFPLAGTPSDIAAEHLNFKVFHDPDDIAGEYCELYVHVDIPRGEVRIDEKDPGYRGAVLKALGRRPAA